MQLTIGIIPKESGNKYYIEDFDTLELNDFQFSEINKTYIELLNLMGISYSSYHRQLQELGAKYDIVSDKDLFDTYKEAQEAIDWMERLIIMNKLVLAGKVI